MDNQNNNGGEKRRPAADPSFLEALERRPSNPVRTSAPVSGERREAPVNTVRGAGSDTAPGSRPGTGSPKPGPGASASVKRTPPQRGGMSAGARNPGVGRTAGTASMSEEERAELARRRRAAEEEIRAAKKERIRTAAGNVFGYGAVFLCLLLIICAVTLSLFLISLISPSVGDNRKMPAEITYDLNGKADNIKTSGLTVDGKLYLNFSEIADICGVSVSGDRTNLKYTSVDGEFISFESASRFASVNGNVVEMEGAAELRGSDLWVPFSFVKTYITGIKVTEEENYIGLERIMLDVGTDEYADPEAQTVAFLLKPNDTLLKISDSSLPAQIITLPDGTPTYEFISDLSSFVKYMDPDDRDAYLVMFNPSHPDDGSYVPTDLVSVVNGKKGLSGLEMRLCAEKSLEALYVEMYAHGFTDVTVWMAYRSYEAQNRQFNIYMGNERVYYKTYFAATGKYFSDAAYAVLGKDYLTKNYINKKSYTLNSDDARRVAASYSAYPGTGDHQTGLSCDMHNLSSTSTEFSKTEAYKWLCENAYKFGFIERYPKGKEKITGFSYEPYHWRFVGQYHASVMHDNGMCLEEYMASRGVN